MRNWIEFISELTYCRLDVRITAKQETFFDAWPGAVIRNNFFYAAENVSVKKDISLSDVINQFPLNEDHPFYKNMAGGFPKGIVLLLGQDLRVYKNRKRIEQGEILSFSLLLIGQQITYYKFYIAALRLMCERGMGHPICPFDLLDIYERHPKKGIRLIATGQHKKIETLSLPVSVSDFVPSQKLRGMRILFQTPTLLHGNGATIDVDGRYQPKLNGFPSFYQLVRSVAFRCMKLTALYVTPDDNLTFQLALKELDQYLKKAAVPVLDRVKMDRVTVRGTLKDNGGKPILFHGYIGEMAYTGDVTLYEQLLLFMQELGVGNDTVYGLGQYRIKY